ELVITGQSQGSSSSIGASRIAPTYAPELNLRATIATGLLPSFPQGPVKLPDAAVGRGTTRYTMLQLVGGSLPDTGPSADSLGTGLADRTIPPQHQYAAAAALCAAGNPLVWKTYPGITHNGGVNVAFDDELRFVRSALANQPIASSCGSLVAPGAPQAATAGI